MRSNVVRPTTARPRLPNWPPVPYLERQIALLRPRLIVALGRPAAQALLNQEIKIGAARGKLFASSPVGGENASRLRVMVMHPMDTGLVSGIPAFYVNKLAVRDEQGRELLRLATFEPVSENPVFSFDFPGRVAGGLRLTGTDNNGNRIDGRIE